jgi:hypothetical protein
VDLIVLALLDDLERVVLALVEPQLLPELLAHLLLLVYLAVEVAAAALQVAALLHVVLVALLQHTHLLLQVTHTLLLTPKVFPSSVELVLGEGERLLKGGVRGLNGRQVVALRSQLHRHLLQLLLSDIELLREDIRARPLLGELLPGLCELLERLLMDEAQLFQLLAGPLLLPLGFLVQLVQVVQLVLELHSQVDLFFMRGVVDVELFLGMLSL